jgi:hypothetical protein
MTFQQAIKISLLSAFLAVTSGCAYHSSSTPSSIPVEKTSSDSLGKNQTPKRGGLLAEDQINSYIENNRQKVLSKATFALHKCRVNTSIGETVFYIIGEQHIYNEESSVFAGYLVRKEGIEMLISEGVGKSIESNEVETNFFNAESILAKQLSLDYPGLSSICRQEGIPIVYLEKYGSSGLREGLTPNDQQMLSNLTPIMEKGGPALKEFMKFMEKYAVTTTDSSGKGDAQQSPQDFFKMMQEMMADSTLMNNLSNMRSLFYADSAGGQPSFLGFMDQSGIINARDSIMAERSINTITKPPYVCKLVRVGEAHLEGMLNIYALRFGCTCEDVPLREVVK